jgi:hypothetical protein
MYEDVVKGEDADAIIHIGDHAVSADMSSLDMSVLSRHECTLCSSARRPCTHNACIRLSCGCHPFLQRKYNQGDQDERRGDGYMSAFQQIISNTPWMPIVGNHEFHGGTKLRRYLDQTWEKWGPVAGGDVPNSTNSTSGYTSSPPLHEAKGGSFDAHAQELNAGMSTATSPLGALLSTANHHGPGLGGSLPSNSSRYFSVDLGLLHLVALDLNLYYRNDDCGEPCIKAQLAWVKNDLEQANKNRDKVPWVIVMSHYPLYCTGCYKDSISARYYESTEAEFRGNANRSAAARMAQESIEAVRASGASKQQIEVEAHSWAPTIQQGSTDAIKDIVPILNEFGTDMYIAGHWHYYESLWPAKDGATGTGGDLLTKSFVNPKKTIHVTTGNGGPPNKDSFNEDCPGPDCGKIPSTRFQVRLPPLPCNLWLLSSRHLLLLSSPFHRTHAPSNVHTLRALSSDTASWLRTIAPTSRTRKLKTRTELFQTHGCWSRTPTPGPSHSTYSNRAHVDRNQKPEWVIGP